MAKDHQSIVIAGAGSIGCHAGACLALAGRDVTLLARPRVADAINAGGLRVSDIDGFDRLLGDGAIPLAVDPSVLSHADVVLVAVKSGDTAAMAELVARHAPESAVVVSLQNGIDNVDRLRAVLGRRRVVAGMVPFNVVQSAEGEMPFHVHRASAGTVLIEAGDEGLRKLLDVAGFAVVTHADMPAVQWGKLLMNLNNALVALSGLPLAAQLADARWRRILATQIDEALAAMKAKGIAPAKVAAVPPALLPTVLRLPDWLFLRLARRMLAIDPMARSSMWEDLERRRKTEIGALQGVVLGLARKAGTPAPLTERIVALIHDAETRGKGSPRLPPEQVAAN
ncbi:ketopantoate reductase [Aminobacter aminovorans]|uniref:2-dehydropantoate 2-reductase n=1 Tax=Aminobacter aminovorans TaxID=83263 RepID=A0A380WT89_AMIAI|nr:2-dehydropantoate 2-reductase [Aminobacter aminovorans]TCS23646.1 ketopantoate reductase [Aminobacter aminovorans]SUU91612.1 2-dehydropantoate 2-reductase [Aminobacter aminovorans]